MRDVASSIPHEGRHAPARRIVHGRAGQLYQRHQDGTEDRIGAFGLVLNALVLSDTRYLDAAVTQLREDGLDVRDEDVACLPPFVRHRINMLGRYLFQPPSCLGACVRRGIRTPPARNGAPVRWASTAEAYQRT
ncbi:hypothetical protein GCM10010145_67810 [Streptomyces ruber]|uniref:Tn3 transposase DDE domain-containing protein n=2 Tax=Streptomyces TaxID=1883 RepID=A0A918EXZ1_9ACTN|nr:transposase [Streptomyces ruber]GGQ88737.1 hypothetical protein GCM10010145_67810 [Streptomyces ruber]